MEARPGLCEELTFEDRLKSSEEASWAHIWRL